MALNWQWEQCATCGGSGRCKVCEPKPSLMVALCRCPGFCADCFGIGQIRKPAPCVIETPEELQEKVWNRSI